MLNFQLIIFSRKSEKLTEEDDFDSDYVYPDDNVARRIEETHLKDIGTY